VAARGQYVEVSEAPATCRRLAQPDRQIEADRRIISAVTKAKSDHRCIRQGRRRLLADQLVTGRIRRERDSSSVGAEGDLLRAAGCKSPGCWCISLDHWFGPEVVRCHQRDSDHRQRRWMPDQRKAGPRVHRGNQQGGVCRQYESLAIEEVADKAQCTLTVTIEEEE